MITPAAYDAPEVTLRSEHLGEPLSLNKAKDTVLRANRKSARSGARFKRRNYADGSMSFQARNGGFLQAEADGGLRVNGKAGGAAATRFRLEILKG